MKKIIAYGVSFLSTLTLSVGCGSAKKAVKTPKGKKEITLPCSNFSSDKKFFRTSSFGRSKDANIAKKKALSNARTQLAGEISSMMKVVGDNYVKSSESNNVEEILERFEENSRTVIKERLNGAKSVCERQTRSKDNTYNYYIALELSGEDLVSEYHETLSKDEALKIDYNYEKFKKTFEKEIDKLR